MIERPILFSAPMVRAILDGSKTQTRRVVKPQPIYDGRFAGNWKIVGKNGHEAATCSPLVGELCPHGRQDDRLWVRENFRPIYPQDPTYNGGRPIEYDYAATYQHGNRLGDYIGIKKRWKPSIHMPRAASRITLEVTGVRVERLQDISEDDALAEGCSSTAIVHEDGEDYTGHYASEEYQDLWESINGPGSWEANPWVWVVEFKRLDQKKGSQS
jgi:hypothetical protein